MISRYRPPEPRKQLPARVPPSERTAAISVAARIRGGDEHLEVHPVIRWMFYIFIFSIPFEYPPRTIPFEVHTITGAIFLLVSLLQTNICFRQIPKALLLFAIYLLVYLLLTLLFSKDKSAAIQFFFNLLQAALLFWTCYNLMRYEAIAETAIMGFSISSMVLAAMLVCGIGTTVFVSASEGDRITVLGQDPNTVAANMALGVIGFIGLAYGMRKRLLRFRFMIWPAVVLLGISLILTGSRGGLLALGIGLLTFTLKQGRMLVVIRNLVLGVIALGVIGYILINTEPMKSRYEKSVKQGNMSGREHIFPKAWDMFLEKPITGWAPVNEQYELKKRTREFEFGDPTKRDSETKATHNLVLEVLTSTGLLGGIPLFSCIALSVVGGWKARRSIQGIVPLAMVMTALMINMTVPLQAAKQFWLILAYALANGSYKRIKRSIASPQRKHGAIRRSPRIKTGRQNLLNQT